MARERRAHRLGSDVRRAAWVAQAAPTLRNSRTRFKHRTWFGSNSNARRYDDRSSAVSANQVREVRARAASSWFTCFGLPATPASTLRLEAGTGRSAGGARAP